VLGDPYAPLLEATTGWLPTADELRTIGERVWHAERIFNVREGVSRESDTLPPRVMNEGIKTGPLKGERIPPERLQEMLDSYYQARGCGLDGIPEKATLERLGLSEYVTTTPSN